MRCGLCNDLAPCRCQKEVAMEEWLKRLFDFQRFEGNERLAALIERAEERYGHILSDEDLEWVSAAGDLDARQTKKGDGDGGKE